MRIRCSGESGEGVRGPDGAAACAPERRVGRLPGGGRIAAPLRIVLLLGAAVAPQAGEAQAPAPDTVRLERDSVPLFRLDAVNVTATRHLEPVFSTPAPVTVFDAAVLAGSGVSSAADLFLSAPGMDVEGVGPTQRRPLIRGLGGQRVLLLEDGLRLNNSRRRADSGEPVGLVWLADLDRVEVVRGPASVLYGSDALGGVVNLVTRRTPAPGAPRTGYVEGSFRSAGAATSWSGGVRGAVGEVGYGLSGGVRRAGDYRAPAGRFGELEFGDPARVRDSGGAEEALRGEVNWRPREGRRIGLRHEEHGSRDSGFGWVDPGLLGADVRTRLTWPDQQFRRTVLDAELRTPGALLGDALDLALFTQDNRRTFLTEVAAPIPRFPSGLMEVRSQNRTAIRTSGARVEIRKLLSQRLLLTWGLDAHLEHADGSDTVRTTVTTSGPPRTTVQGGAALPPARLASGALFVQARADLGPSTAVTVGTRLQEVSAVTRPDAGSAEPARRHRDGSLVGAVNLLHRLSPRHNLVASVSRGFRSPNLVERFFSGPAPGGSGTWEPNPDLGPEGSLNVELGFRVRSERLRGQLFVFRSALRDGIALQDTGREEAGVPVYRNVNVDRLVLRGVEAEADLSLWPGWTLEGSMTLLDVSETALPSEIVREAYPSKAVLALAWEEGSGRMQARIAARRTGGWDPSDPATAVGPAAPSVTVLDARGGVRLPGGLSLGLSLENLGDALYAQPLNTSFFRPEPGRTVSLWLRAER